MEELTREAFWNVYRPGCLEHYVLHCFLGHIMYARAELELDGGGTLPIMTFGPLSVHPDHRGKGFGRLLLERSMELAEIDHGVPALAITGSIDLYGRFGFVKGKELSIRYAEDPEADYFLVKELRPGALTGIRAVYRDPEGYFISPEEAEAFDSTFPPKVKEKLPDQLP